MSARRASSGLQSDAVGNDQAEGVATRAALGVHLHDLRVRSGKSLREAASLAGLSPTFVSLVERGQTEIALSRLIRLADVYEANLADLIAELRAPEVEYVKAAQAHVAPRSAGEPRVAYLASPSWQLQPFRIEVAPGDQLEELAHAGEEFIHCIQGRLVITVGGGDWDLQPGDTIVIPPHAVHAYRNPGRRTAVGVGAVVPPGRAAHLGRAAVSGST